MAKLDPKLLARAAAAQASGGGNYINHGTYLFIVDGFLIKDNDRGTSVIVELYVAEGGPAGDGKQEGGPPNPKGSRCSVVFKLAGGTAKANDAAASNLKSFVTNFVGADAFAEMMAEPSFGANEAERYGEVLNRLASIARGSFVADETRIGTIQSGPNAGKNIVNHKWLHVDTADADQLMNIALLDGKAVEAALKPEKPAAEALAAA